MERKQTLNESSGKQISDLEALLILMNKLLEDKLEQKPKAGITLAKGQPNERRLRYTEARSILRQLEAYFGVKGCFSMGVCQTCFSLNSVGHGNPAFGTCQKSGKDCHIWDSCPQHSEKGGGYGL